MIRNVLVATDFSETSEGGLRWGAEIARAQHAKLILVHALRLPSIATPYVPVPPDLDLELEQQVTARLAEIATRLADAGFQLETDIRHDDPAVAIRDAALHWQADLAVIGTRGLSGLEHLILGSVAERVISIAPCPVLSVHPGDYDRHRPLRKILVPTDFSDEARRSAELVLDLIAERAKGELILLHAYHVPVEYSAYGALPTSWSFFDQVPRTAKTELDKWASHLSSSGWKVTTQIAEGTPASVIVRLAKELDVDLVAMGTHGRSGLKAFMLGSVARRVVQHAPCPVLTVRRHDQG